MSSHILRLLLQGEARLARQLQCLAAADGLDETTGGQVWLLLMFIWASKYTLSQCWL